MTAGWGHRGKGGVTMPGKGRSVERDFTSDELAGLSAEPSAFDCLGKTTCDVYLNERAYWKNLPAGVWEFTIGGYQVVKKWLSYREKALFGRGLKLEEARYVTEMSRRIAALLLVGPALDANYRAVKAATYTWHNAQPADRPGSRMNNQRRDYVGQVDCELGKGQMANNTVVACPEAA